MMADLGIAEIRAEGRRLAEAIGPEAYDRYIDYLRNRGVTWEEA